MFSHIDEMDIFWNIDDLDPRHNPVFTGNTVREYLQFTNPETFLNKRYIKNKKWNYKEDICSSMEYMRNSLCIINTSILDLFWYKYNWQQIIKSCGLTQINTIHTHISFEYWLDIYCNGYTKNIDEDIILDSKEKVWK
jgi:hypothetical protein